MSIKANIIYQLNFGRKMLNGVFETLKSDEEWMAQPCPGTNHPLWIAGHLGLADNMFASRLQGEQHVSPEGWEELFWFGSKIDSDPLRYPAVVEVRAYFDERRENLLNVIEATDESVLLSPTPEGRFADAPNIGAMLIFAAFHEGVHAGAGYRGSSIIGTRSPVAAAASRVVVPQQELSIWKSRLELGRDFSNRCDQGLITGH